MPISTDDSIRRNPYVFAVGCPRSGTTLLQRMLDHHPLLTVANDTHFIPRAVAGRDGNPVLDADLVEAVRTYHRFQRLGLNDAAVDAAASDATTYSEFVERLYDQLAAQHGKPLAGEKTPDYVRSLRLLAQLFPWARVLHIIRDGRDVTLSTLSWANERKGPGRFRLWQEEPLAVCALWWKWQVSAGRRDRAAFGEQYREIRYERLVAEPAVVTAEIATFLDLDEGAEMARFHEGRTRDEPGLSAKKAWLPPIPGLRDWRSMMGPRDVELFEALAGDLLETLGYELASSHIPDAVAERAESCRRRFESELEEREGGARSRSQ